MKALSSLFIVLTLIGGLNAQPISGVNNEKVIKYFNGFQHTKNDPTKIPLALSCAQGLAKESLASLQHLLHDHYAQAFSPLIRGQADNTTERKLLDLLVKDTNQVLSAVIQPVALWVKVQENVDNSAELTNLANQFITTQLEGQDPYPNRTARYALLIYQILEPNTDCRQIAQHLLTTTIAILSKAVTSYVPPMNATRDAKRAWLRYLYAYSNLLKAQEVQKDDNYRKVLSFYRLASEYSPDLLDQNSKPGFHYDMVFLAGSEGKESFKQDFLQFLSSNPDNSESLQALTELSISDPANLSVLKTFYQQHYSDKASFADYWDKALNSALSPAPLLTVELLDNQSFSLQDHRGKWILIDFWGTWCSPCLKEMPQLQGFYREIMSKHADKISLLTIACKDTEPKVRTYLNKNRYNFPVAISDGTAEKEYSITVYPTKILITPQGKQIIIPSEENWIEKVKLFCEL